MKRNSGVLAAVILFLCGAQGNAQQTGVEQELRNLMQTEFEAFKRRDAKDYDRRVAGDALYAGSGHRGWKTKAQILKEIQNAPASFANASLELNEVQVRLYGDTAILHCLATFTFKEQDGKDTKAQFQMTRVHIRRQGKWQLVSHHGSAVR